MTAKDHLLTFVLLPSDRQLRSNVVVFQSDSLRTHTQANTLYLEYMSEGSCVTGNQEENLCNTSVKSVSFLLVSIVRG